MMMFTASIILNVVFLLAVGYWIYVKGGFAYFAKRMKHKRACRPETDRTYASPKDFYFAKASLLDVLPRTRDGIIFLGDSVTYAAHWYELLENPDVKNRGLPGDRTELMLSRLDQIISESPRKIFMMVGINDLRRAYKISSIVSNYTTMLRRFSTEIPQTEIYIQSVLPVNDVLYDVKVNNQDIIRLNGQLELLAGRYGATYIDLFPLFTDRNGCLHRKFTSHGIHLNGKGYLVWKAAIENYVRERREGILPVGARRVAGLQN